MGTTSVDQPAAIIDAIGGCPGTNAVPPRRKMPIPVRRHPYLKRATITIAMALVTMIFLQAAIPTGKIY